MKILKDSIFISIVAFKDLELSKTVEDIFEKAKHPENITVGIVNQDNEIYAYTGKYRVKVLHEDPEEFLGYCACRYKCNKELYNGEEFYLQIAPHSVLKKNFDEYFIKTIKDFDKKTMLVRIPWDIKPDRKTITEKGIRYIKRLGEPCTVEAETVFDYKFGKRVYFTYAGQIFCYATWIKDVPYDKWLWCWGEEIDISCRSYIAGYKMILCENQVYHIYGQKNRKGFHRDINADETFRRENYTSKRIFNKLFYHKYTELMHDWDRFGTDLKKAKEWCNKTGAKIL